MFGKRNDTCNDSRTNETNIRKMEMSCNRQTATQNYSLIPRSLSGLGREAQVLL